MTPSHEEWEEASRARDKCARLAVRALLQGRTAAALEYANQSDAWERTMSRIAAALESQGEE
jgi:hypothetical protein